MTEEEQDAITVLTAKSVELFLQIRKSISDGLTKEQMTESEANQIALALTPKPIEMLSVIYTGFDENLEWMDNDIEEDGIPDDDILKQYQRGDSDAQDIEDREKDTGN
jgi:hypothetical protein